MDCIPYINDLQIEINILKDIKKNSNCDVSGIDNKIKEKELLLDNCKNNLLNLSNNSIEYRLYLKILNGLSPTRAIEEVSNENYMNDIKPSSPSNIWIYYKKLQKKLKQE